MTDRPLWSCLPVSIGGDAVKLALLLGDFILQRGGGQSLLAEEMQSTARTFSPRTLVGRYTQLHASVHKPIQVHSAGSENVAQVRKEAASAAGAMHCAKNAKVMGSNPREHLKMK